MIPCQFYGFTFGNHVAKSQPLARPVGNHKFSIKPGTREPTFPNGAHCQFYGLTFGSHAAKCQPLARPVGNQKFPIKPGTREPTFPNWPLANSMASHLGAMLQNLSPWQNQLEIRNLQLSLAPGSQLFQNGPLPILWLHIWEPCCKISAPGKTNWKS